MLTRQNTSFTLVQRPQRKLRPLLLILKSIFSLLLLFLPVSVFFWPSPSLYFPSPSPFSSLWVLQGWNFKQELWSPSMTLFPADRGLCVKRWLWEGISHRATPYIPGLWLPFSLAVITACFLTTTTSVPYMQLPRDCVTKQTESQLLAMQP